MTTSNWVTAALRDIRKVMDDNRYDVAAHHIDDAISAIVARDSQGDDSCDDETFRRWSVTGRDSGL